MTAIELLNAELIRKTGSPLDQEQVDCLMDVRRYDEATDMLDDMEARMGISVHVRGEVADWLTQRAEG